MGMLELFKKKSSTAISRSQQLSLSQTVNMVYEQTGKRIADGLSRPTASTGTAIDDLHGAAKTIAQMSNIGGGSKATGGGGIADGMNTIVKHKQATAVKNIIEGSTGNKLRK